MIEERTGPGVAAPPRVDLATARLCGAGVESRETRLGDLVGVFRDEAAWRAMPGEAVVYRVQAHLPVEEGVEGGLFFGNTVLEPGRVGDEYYMTRGHFHAERNRGEYYVGVAGSGALILMDESRRAWWEPMSPGTIHYVPGHTAHRVANVGSEPLSFLACWPSDAGHDYEAIAAGGFSARLREMGGTPTLVPA